MPRSLDHDHDQADFPCLTRNTWRAREYWHQPRTRPGHGPRSARTSQDGRTETRVTADRELADGAAFIDGEVVSISQARIPITDTGFTRSDLTYDVVSVWD